MEKTARSHEQDTPCEGRDRTQMFAPQPCIAEEDRGEIHGQHVAGKDIDHGNLRQQTADQDVRAQEAVISELEAIAAAAQTDPGRQKRALFQAGVSYRLSQCGVLAQPVCMGTEYSAIRHDHGDEYEQKKSKS